MSTEEYGIADLIFTIAQFVIPFVSLVIFDAVMRFGLSKDEKKEDVLLCSLVVFAFGSIITAVITPLIGLYEPIAKWKWHLCIYVIITVFQYVEMNYIKASGQNKLYAIMSITQTLCMAVLNILLIVVVPLGIDGYVIANMVSALVAATGMFIFGGVFRGIRKAKFSGKLLKKMLAFSAPLILNNISWWVIFSANKIVVEIALGASILGIYTVASKIPSLINIFISVFQQSWGISTIKEMESSNDSKFYTDILNVFSFIAYLMSIGLIFIIKPLMTVYVGADFVDAWRYIPLLLASATFSALASYYASFYSALKKSLNNMFTTLVAATINILTAILFVNQIGLWAAILGTFFAYFVLCIIRMIDVSRFVGFKIDIVRFVINSIILIAEAVMVSLEIQIYLVSSVALILFLAVNFKQIGFFVKKSKTYIRKIQFSLRDRTINNQYRKRLKNNDFSIISNDCLGGVICKDLRCRFNSPTVNFYFSAEDYIKFISNLKEYVENGSLTAVTGDSDYVKVAISVGGEEIVAHCLHYKTAEEFIEKWNLRKARINYDNCFFMLSDRNGFTEEHLKAFESLPYKNKVCFVHKEYPNYPSAYHIKGVDDNGMVKVMTDYKHSFGIKRRYDDFDFVSWLNSGVED
jgi:uncharacterized protein (DUF1919 family)